MKKLNKKGFTLIELLAVIVILAILVTISVPAVTRYLATARKDTYVTNAQTAISAARNDVITSGAVSRTYTFAEINDLLESGRKLSKSPYGNTYSDSSYISVSYDDTTNVTTYSVCLVDSASAGIPLTPEGEVTADTVQTTGVTCTRPSGS